jgi:outer membrane protein, multidrug efflux system
MSREESDRRACFALESNAQVDAVAAALRVRYREGVADFLALLDAERTELQAREAVAQAEAGVFTGAVST